MITEMCLATRDTLKRRSDMSDISGRWKSLTAIGACENEHDSVNGRKRRQTGDDADEDVATKLAAVGGQPKILATDIKIRHDQEQHAADNHQFFGDARREVQLGVAI